MAVPRILVVEDDALFAENLVETLEGFGYAIVATVKTGREAIRKAGETQPSLVLMDIGLRGDMNGIEAAEQLHTGLHIPVVFLTAYDDEETLQRAKIAEPHGYILKDSFSEKELRKSIELALYKAEMERSLRESRELLDGIVGSISDHMSMMDEHLNIIWANDVAKRVFGADLIGKKCYSVFHQNDKPCEPCIVMQTFADGKLHEREKEVIGHDGRPIMAWCTSNVAARHSDGRPRMVVELGRDITFRKLAEDQLRRAHDELESRVIERTAELGALNQELQAEMAKREETRLALEASEQLFRAVFQTIPDAVFIKDRSLSYTLVNPCMENLLDRTSSEILGRTDEEVFGAEAGAHLRAVDSRVLEGEVIEEMHTRPVKGFPMTFLDVRGPMRNVEGHVEGICGVSRNVTERSTSRKPVEEIADEYPSEAMRAVLASARMAAGTDTTILLNGESGSGKDYLANYIHQSSRRSAGVFRAINCAAIPIELAESELFGHEGGAFTGATRRRRGFIELAEGGTLLLNEVGELPLQLQTKLLSFLDTLTFTRVGGEKSVSANVRLIAATAKDLLTEVDAGRFRKDFYYRLNVFAIRVPPLRDRLEDLPDLTRSILTRLGTEMQLTIIPEIEPEAMAKLNAYAWPGNVRELKNVLERALILSQGGTLEAHHLKVDTTEHAYEVEDDVLPPNRSVIAILGDIERSYIEKALVRTNGNKKSAAQLLGLSRHALDRHMKKLGMTGP